ncbi:MAG: NAD-dependent epimerase [Flavobacteriales bacterium]|nr:NAD-dependent epimerase [Flavobacteriales bacterium]|tara:strand:- start:2524 stop:3480 length:957 start_codon:yes stop_codon:yes gene_type:complete
MKKRILITGCNGQVGTKLYDFLNHKGNCKIIASDIAENKFDLPNFERLDVTNYAEIANVVVKHRVTQIYHMAAILSSKGEINNQLAWDVNMNGLLNVLNIAKDYNINKVFYPSSIAVFAGPFDDGIVYQSSICTPKTMYGINKLAGENLCNYYHTKYGLDIRSLRYPGIIGPENNAGGGTTDYAVEIFHHALDEGCYDCFLSAPTTLPMIYIDDAIRATIELMKAPKKLVQIRTSYNIGGLSFSPFQLSQEIKKHIPDFRITYFKDHRQEIADSWPFYIKDNEARLHWGWKPQFGLSEIVETVISTLKATTYTNSNTA